MKFGMIPPPPRPRKIRIKIFKDNDIAFLEQKVHDWLDRTGIEPLKIDYQFAISGVSDYAFHSVMIQYEEYT